MRKLLLVFGVGILSLLLIPATGLAQEQAQQTDDDDSGIKIDQEKLQQLKQKAQKLSEQKQDPSATGQMAPEVRELLAQITNTTDQLQRQTIAFEHRLSGQKALTQHGKSEGELESLKQLEAKHQKGEAKAESKLKKGAASAKGDAETQKALSKMEKSADQLQQQIAKLNQIVNGESEPGAKPEKQQKERSEDTKKLKQQN